MNIKFWIFDFRFWIGGIASLYPLIKQIEYLKSKIGNPNSKINKIYNSVKALQ